MGNNWKRFVALLAITLLPSIVTAGSKIGIVDKEVALTAMPEHRLLVDKITYMKQQADSAYQKATGEEMNKTAPIDKKLLSPNISENEKKALNEEIEKIAARVADIKISYDSELARIDQEVERLRKSRDAKFEEMAQEISKKRKLDYIIDSGAIWGIANKNDVIDVTDDFMELLTSRSEDEKGEAQK